jgi:SAM-dependent methyltransferase
VSLPKLARRIARSVAPSFLHGAVYATFYRARAVTSVRLAGRARFCPCCNHAFRRFVAWNGREGIRCPRCGSHERQRLLLLYLRARTDLFLSDHHLLHVAPEPSLVPHLLRLPNLEYLRADLDHPLAEPVDLTDMRFEDDTFDVVICNHVLEHIPDDRRAMQELFRVLVPGGWAVLQVPIELGRERTLEDPSITSPSDRLRMYGDEDHKRLYGRDYVDRLRSVGFEVELDDFASRLSRTLVERCALDPDEVIFRCARPPADVGS